MDDDRQDDRPAVMEPWDALVRESLSPNESRPLGRTLVLGALAALLVVTGVGTTILVIRDLRAQGSQLTSASPSALATATVPSGTPTPTPARDPKDNGWTQATLAAGDIKFSASSPQRGYFCGSGRDQNGRIIFGVTTDGGQTWVVGPSPTAYDECSIQVSPTNALDVVLNGVVGSCGPCPDLDAHYSTDGGKTWRAAPIPPNTVRLGGALWSSAYLYVWSGAFDFIAQHSFLKVSANGGPFTTIDLNTLLPGAQNVSIGSAVASGIKLYLNLTYTGCSSQKCQAIVASGDGGKTWAQVPTKASIAITAVVGITLYGKMTDPQDPQIPIEVRSSDNGATWAPVTFPRLPDGQVLDSRSATSCLPMLDGTIFVAPPYLGVAYLRAGAWTVIPFSSAADLDTLAAVSFAANGQPQRVWGLIGAQASDAGIYWHALP